jgi:hypothetical protein
MIKIERTFYLAELPSTCACKICIFIFGKHSSRIESSAGILEQSIGTRNRVVIGLSYRPARLHRLVESIPWDRFLNQSLKLKSRYGTRN